MLADLHSHSTVSDGMLTPTELAQRAHANGVTLWALTDHDEVGGLAQAAQSAAALGMDFLNGVESSVTYANRTVHIVGLGIDPENPTLVQGLAQTRSGREQRARDMALKLEALGVAGAYEGAVALAGNPELLSRTHLARYVVAQGHCSSMQQVFDRYLGDDGPAFVPHQWAKLADAVSWIRGAGGVAIIAHPARYKFTSLLEDALFTDFVAAGGQGLEVATGSHRLDELPTYADLGRQFQLAHSCGSDFHGSSESRHDLGHYPQIKLDLPAVWDLIPERIQRAPARA